MRDENYRTKRPPAKSELTPELQEKLQHFHENLADQIQAFYKETPEAEAQAATVLIATSCTTKEEKTGHYEVLMVQGKMSHILRAFTATINESPDLKRLIEHALARSEESTGDPLLDLLISNLK
jgi:hypothetical protein